MNEHRATDDYGQLIAPDAIRFERLLPGPIERVWAFLVEPDKRARWLADGPMDVVADGEVALHFRNAELSRDDDPAPEKYRDYENSGDMYGRIQRCEPPHFLSFTWCETPGPADEDDSIVEIELRSEGDRVRLTLTHRRLHEYELLPVSGGWHTHLGVLDDVLSDREPRPFWRSHTRAEAEYAVRLGVED